MYMWVGLGGRDTSESEEGDTGGSRGGLREHKRAEQNGQPAIKSDLVFDRVCVSAHHIEAIPCFLTSCKRPCHPQPACQGAPPQLNTHSVKTMTALVFVGTLPSRLPRRRCQLTRRFSTPLTPVHLPLSWTNPDPSNYTTSTAAGLLRDLIPQ